MLVAFHLWVESCEMRERVEAYIKWRRLTTMATVVISGLQLIASSISEERAKLPKKLKLAWANEKATNIDSFLSAMSQPVGILKYQHLPTY
jgi:hypothetical protein